MPGLKLGQVTQSHISFESGGSDLVYKISGSDLGYPFDYLH